MAADLHVHSVYSDGRLTPGEIVEAACRLGLKAVAIVDHDCVDGVPEARQAANGRIEVVEAIEIDVEEEGEEIHVLGYFLDLNSERLLPAMQKLRRNRLRRVKKFVKKLSEAGLEVSLEEVLARAGPGVVCRPHLAETLVSKGYATSQSDAFRRYLSLGAPTYVPREQVSAQEAIELIRELSGVPVLAHAAKINSPSLLFELIKKGIVGLEVYHPDHSARGVERLSSLAESEGLLITGGSDSHGPSGLRGFAIGERTCTDEQVSRLRLAAQEIRG